MADEKRPSYLPADANESCDWFSANGVDECLPEKMNVIIGPATLTYTSFIWSGTRGWAAENLDVACLQKERTEQRTVPLRSPLTERVRTLLEQYGHTVTTTGGES